MKLLCESLGFPKDELPYARRVERDVRARGYGDNVVIGLFSAWDAMRPEVKAGTATKDGFWSLWQWHAKENLNLQEGAYNVIGFAVEDAIAKGPAGLESVTPASQSDLKRRDEILRIMRTDSRAYWRDQDMQDELFGINERIGAAQQLGHSTERDYAPSMTIPIERQLKEKMKLLRENPSEYYREENQAEVRALFQAQIGETPEQGQIK